MEHKRKLIYTTNLQIRWGDLDAMNHVNNTAYFRYMEQARIEWFESLGYDTGQLLGEVLQRGARTREAIRQGLGAALPGFRGATGSFQADAAGQESRKQIPVLRWSGTEWISAR